MKTVRDILRDADPLRHETDQLQGERDRLRRAVVAAASDAVVPPSRRVGTTVALFATIALAVGGFLAVGSQIWSHGGATLQAAIRFEVRLAEDHRSADVREVRVAGSDRVVYVHQEAIVTNDDIAHSSVIQTNGSSRFGISVEFNAAGTRKMREATKDHVGRPVAILIDGDVVATPVVKSPIGPSAVISGDFTRTEAERIVNGIALR